MKNILLILALIIGIQHLTAFAQNNSFKKIDSTLNRRKNLENNNSEIRNNETFYMMYNGFGEFNSSEYHIFMKNDTENIAYLLSATNLELWSLQKLMPKELEITQIYKANIILAKLVPNDEDPTMQYFEILKISKISVTDEID